MLALRQQNHAGRPGIWYTWAGVDTPKSLRKQCLDMAEHGKKSFRLPAELADRFDAIVASVQTPGGGTKPSSVCSAAILGFLELDRDAQLTLIARARNYDLEVLRKNEAGEHEAEAAKREDAVALAAEQAASPRKRAKKRTGA